MEQSAPPEHMLPEAHHRAQIAAQGTPTWMAMLRRCALSVEPAQKQVQVRHRVPLARREDTTATAMQQPLVLSAPAVSIRRCPLQSARRVLLVKLTLTATHRRHVCPVRVGTTLPESS